MLLCLYRHPVVTPDRPRLAMVRPDDIVDINLAAVASMVPNMKPRRAVEIADALVPADLLSFLEGGRPSWNALADTLERLGDDLQLGLETPDDEQVVLPKPGIRLVPVVPPAAGWSSEALGAWTTMPIPSPGSTTIVGLHTNGQAYLPEYFAVLGSPVVDVSPAEGWAAVSLVAVVRPSRPESACMLHRPPALPDDELDLVPTISTAVAAASAIRTLYTGDVVRCGPAIVQRSFDLRTAPTARTEASDIVPSR